MGHWHGGSTRAWRRIREEVFAAKGRTCLLAFEPWGDDDNQRCSTVATEVHHTEDRDVVGDDPRFLIPACQPCNLKAGDPTRDRADPDPLPSW